MMDEIFGLVQQGLGNQFNMASGLGKSAYGAMQYWQGNKALKSLNANRPTYNIDPFYESNAQQGIPQASADQFFRETNQNLSSGITAIERGGGSLNLISQLKGQNDNLFLKFLALDAEKRIENQRELAGEKRKAWDYNTNIPFQQKWNAATQATNSGAQNVFGGIDQIANSFTAGGGQGGSGSGGRSESDWSNGSGWGSGSAVNPYYDINQNLQSQYGIYTG